MKTTIITHQQGSAAWHQHRARSLNASELAGVMGMSAYTSRSELIKQKATGITPEVDAHTQRRLDSGHEFEAIARPWAEEIIGSDLYPVVLAGEIDGLSLSASLDGLDMMQAVSFEHKTGRADLLASLDQGVIPVEYHPQMEMGLMLSGAEKCLFMASSGDKEAMRWAWYLPNPELRAKIIPAWAQFKADLAAYIPPPAAEIIVAEPVQALPAVMVQVSGEISIKDNFRAFETALRDFLEHRLIRAPKTDQDFADLDLQIKAMKGAEAALDAAEVQMLAQVQTFDQAKKVKDMLAKLVRDNRLMAEKLLASEKERRKAAIVSYGFDELREHIANLNVRIGKNLMPTIVADFASAVKGLRSLDSMEDAVLTRLANAKIEAGAIADRIQINLSALNDRADLAFLFADVATLVLKESEFVAMAIKNRIAEHQAAELAKEEATRQRIRVEEQAKAEAAARLVIAQELATAAKAESEAREKLLAEQAAELAEAKRMSAIQAQGEKVAAEFAAQQNAPQIIQEIIQVAPAVEYIAVPAANVLPIRASQPAVQTPPTLKLGQIGERLGFNLTGEFLKSLGFEPAARSNNAVLFHEADFTLMLTALHNHLDRVQARRAA